MEDEEECTEYIIGGGVALHLKGARMAPATVRRADLEPVYVMACTALAGWYCTLSSPLFCDTMHTCMHLFRQHAAGRVAA